MNCLVKPFLVAAAFAGASVGCATYDYGYGYRQPYAYSYDYRQPYAYSYDYGPYYYYGNPYYYYYGPGFYVPPAVSFGFSYRDRDRHWDSHRHSAERDRHGGDRRWSGRDRTSNDRGRAPRTSASSSRSQPVPPPRVAGSAQPRASGAVPSGRNGARAQGAPARAEQRS